MLDINTDNHESPRVIDSAESFNYAIDCLVFTILLKSNNQKNRCINDIAEEVINKCKYIIYPRHHENIHNFSGLRAKFLMVSVSDHKNNDSYYAAFAREAINFCVFRHGNIVSALNIQRELKNENKTIA